MGEDSPHNAIITNARIIVIPRTRAKIGKRAVNAAGMLGMIWVKTEGDLEVWKQYGPKRVLTQVDVPRLLS